MRSSGSFSERSASFWPLATISSMTTGGGWWLILMSSGIHNHQAGGGGKPNPSVRRLATGRLHAAGTFQRRHAVAHAVIQAVNRVGLAVGTGIERVLGDTENPVVGTDPEISVAVLFKPANEVARQTLRGVDFCKPSVFQPAQAARRRCRSTTRHPCPNAGFAHNHWEARRP